MVLFSSGFEFLSNMCLLLCLFVREKALLSLEWRDETVLGLITGNIQSVSEMKLTFLESRFTVHMRAELLTKSSPLTRTQLAIFSPLLLPLFS